MQSIPAPVASGLPSRQPRLDARIPVQFTEAPSLALALDPPKPASPVSSSNAAALSLAAGPFHPAEEWDDFGLARTGSPLSDWPL